MAKFKAITITEQMQDIREFFLDLPKGKKAYFVGGCVRDNVLGDAPHDYDIITNMLPEETESYIKSQGRKCYNIGKRFGTLGVKINGEMIEITTFRKEEYDGKSRKPLVEFTSHLDQDLNRRDFTINTMVIDMNFKLKDLKNGLKDLKSKTLRTVSNSKRTFKDDPLRILRAIRFASKYDMYLETMTARRVESCRWEMLRLSRERIISEINKIFELPADKLARALRLMWEYKLWQVIIPELQLQYNYNQNSKYHDFKLHEHTIEVVKAVRDSAYGRCSDNKAELWVALLHDIAKPFVRTDKYATEISENDTMINMIKSNYIDHEKLGARIANDFCLAYKFSNKSREFIVESIENHLQEDSWLRVFDDASKSSKPFDNTGKRK